MTVTVNLHNHVRISEVVDFLNRHAESEMLTITTRLNRKIIFRGLLCCLRLNRRLDLDVPAVFVNDVGFAAEAVCNFEIRIALVR